MTHPQKVNADAVEIRRMSDKDATPVQRSSNTAEYVFMGVLVLLQLLLIYLLDV